MINQYYKEKCEHSSELVPYSYYESQIPDYFPNVLLHYHKEFEINFVRSGKGEFSVGDDRYIAGAGDIILIQPNILHAVYQYEDEVLLYDTVVFSADMLLGRCNDRSTLEYILPLIKSDLIVAPLITKANCNYQTLAANAQRIVFAAKENTAYSDLVMKGNLFSFFSSVLQDCDRKIVLEKNVNYSELIKPAIEYMDEHYSERITIEQLAGITHLSSSYFMKAFKQCAGMGAIEYLNCRRIKEVCEQLRKRKESISEIALSCGFSNLSNFNRHFRRQVGLSPKEYSERAG